MIRSGHKNGSDADSQERRMDLRRSWAMVVAKIGLRPKRRGRLLTSIETLLCESQPACEEAHPQNQNCDDQIEDTENGL
jgi:hypothetical protein